jgi:predicted metal-binding membrane protein
MLLHDRPMPPTSQDPVLVRDRTTVLTSAILLLIAAAAWIFVVLSSVHGEDMAMAMPMSIFGGLVFIACWAVMMTAMMLPSALPMIALYGAMQRGAAPDTKGVPQAVFTLVYLGLWAATGLPVYFAHTLLAALAGSTLAYAIAVILVAAGAYQLSPLKQVCLRVCRSPLGFLLGHWRAGRRGSLALGWSHALYCLGCCWALMLVLVAAGAMGLPWVLLITALVAAEKLMWGGEWAARIAGSALVLLGVTVALRPDLVSALRTGHPM